MPLLELVIAAAAISTADLRREFPVSSRDRAIVQDATSRWGKKIRSQEPLEDRVPIVFYLSKQRCVALRLRATSVGANPVYCYHLTEDIFLEAADELE